MNPNMPDNLEDQLGLELDRLFLTYREACAAPEAGPDFMPQLWRMIEAQRLFSVPKWPLPEPTNR